MLKCQQVLAFTCWHFNIYKQENSILGIFVVGILTFMSKKNSILVLSLKAFVGIFTFMSGKNSILGLSEPEKCCVS